MAQSEKKALDCSVVVPLYNEGLVVDELYQRITAVMKQISLSYEIILVDDGSEDHTLEKVRSIAEKDSTVVVIELRRNFGQTPALAAGFDLACGQVIISMDGDLQHAPEEIPNFLEKINEGYDVVSGWRKQRVDNMIMRKIPSRAANWIASKISGVEIHDFGTTYKAYRSEILKELKLYGEMHRFIPALLSQIGAKIAEIPIQNILRPKGTSNYGISRLLRVFFDLITLTFLLHYVTRPIHFFGKAAFYCILTSLVIAAYLLVDKFYFLVPISVAHLPLAGMAGILFLVGLIFISSGLISELISRIYFESTGKTIYSIRRIYTKEEQAENDL
jgi:glycosyltransferase involved in cell wall biosynthesis